MREFDPVQDVDNSGLIVDNGGWPNFHDAEVHELKLWRGDVRPHDNVWIGPVMEVAFELCAIEHPYLVVLAFHDCEDIRLQAFDHQNALYDLAFAVEERGTCRDGTPLTPYICVTFRQAMGLELSFKCFRVRAVARTELPGGA